MASRAKKTTKPAPQGMEEAREWLALLGKRQRELEAIKAGMNEQITDVKKDAEQAAQPIKAIVAELEDGIQIWAEANRSELTKKSKTVDLGTGTINWRHRPPSVSTRGKKDDLLERLRSLGLLKFIRTTEDLNKEAMLADPVTAQSVTGITVKSEGEDFVITPAEEELAVAS